MELDINRDPQEISKKITTGKQWWQYLFIGTAVFIGILITLVFNLNSTLNGIICAFIAFPLGYIGVFEKNGLDFFQYRKIKKFNSTGKNIFLYENPIPEKKKESGKDNEKKSSFLHMVIFGK